MTTVFEHGSRFRSAFAAAAFLVAAFFALAVPVPAAAGNVSWPQDTALYIETPDITLDILSGSSADSLSITATAFTVTVAAAERFTVRYPGPNPGALVNDGGLASCQYSGGNNIVRVDGPATVTFTPSATPICVGSSGGGSTPSGASLPPKVTVGTPNGGESYVAGTTQTLFWSTSGGTMLSVRITMSTDGGAAYSHVIAASEPNDGLMNWTVPELPTTKARVRIEGLALDGTVQASDASDADFAVTRSVAEALADAPEDIDADKELAPEEGEEGTASDPLGALCGPSRLAKSPSATAVYYCGKDGKRYVFPHQNVYLSWYPDFSGVVSITDAELAAIPIGGNVTYKPGTRMVKIQSDPKVYLVGRGGLLRWIPTEVIAAAIYGPEWNKKIDDVDVAFFVNYAIGEDVTLEEVEAIKAGL